MQFEDFAADNAFRFIKRYRDLYCTFNDDIQGTAAVVVAGLLSACRLVQKPITEHRVLFFGAGGAASGAAALLNTALIENGLSEADALKHIYMFDKDGLVVKSRTDLTPLNKMFGQDMEHMRSLQQVVDTVKPTAIIGAAGVGPMFTPELLRSMATHNERPIVFALSNPTSKSECTAEQAYTHTDGRAVFCSGSPFPDWTSPATGQVFHPGQGNNAYIFPGVALAVILFGIRHINREHFYIAAKVGFLFCERAFIADIGRADL